MNNRLATMENLRKAIDRGKFYDDEINWKNFEYVEILRYTFFKNNRLVWLVTGYLKKNGQVLQK